MSAPGKKAKKQPTQSLSPKTTLPWSDVMKHHAGKLLELHEVRKLLFFSRLCHYNSSNTLHTLSHFVWDVTRHKNHCARRRASRESLRDCVRKRFMETRNSCWSVFIHVYGELAHGNLTGHKLYLPPASPCNQTPVKTRRFLGNSWFTRVWLQGEAGERRRFLEKSCFFYKRKSHVKTFWRLYKEKALKRRYP